MVGLEIFGHTDVGRTRPTNQDSYLALPLESRGVSGYLLVVADGMGGHQGGAVASEIGVTTLRESVERRLQSPEAAAVGTVLEAAVQDANRAVHEAASRNESLRGMGTTLVAALVVGETALVANVGDSRAYLVEAGAIRQITGDHVWEREASVAEELDAIQIAESPYRGMLTRSVGVNPDVSVDLHDLQLPDGCHLLLCSDGVHRHLRSEVLRDTIIRLGDPERICRELITLANEAGGKDNITCVVALAHGRAGSSRSSDTVKLATPGSSS